MLAKIFMMRLEAAARVPEEIAPSSTSRFIPLAPNSKPISDRPLEALREERLSVNSTRLGALCACSKERRRALQLR